MWMTLNNSETRVLPSQGHEYNFGFSRVGGGKKGMLVLAGFKNHIDFSFLWCILQLLKVKHVVQDDCS